MSEKATNLITKESSLVVNRENALTAKAELVAYALELGYTTVNSLSDLILSEEEIGKIGAANFEEIKRTDDPELGIYLRGTHDSGGEVKVLAYSQPTPDKEGRVYAHFFSPNDYEGHGFNNDFYSSEMRRNLVNSLHGPVYSSRPGSKTESD